MARWRRVKSVARIMVDKRVGGEWRRRTRRRVRVEKIGEEEEERCNEGLCMYDESGEKMNGLKVPR